MADQTISFEGTFFETLGIRMIEATAQRVIAEMDVRPDLMTVGGRLHGGALMSLADSVGAYGAFLALPPGAAGTTTIESKTNFFAGAANGIVRAESVPLHSGARTSVWQTRITNEAGRLVSQTVQTQLVLTKQP
ncbi:MAG TPA: PaaI family thioesterase [Stellaceae bacterium]